MVSNHGFWMWGVTISSGLINSSRSILLSIDLGIFSFHFCLWERQGERY